MTIEQAIIELQEDKKLYESEICRAFDGTPDGELIGALDMAIEALGKQIPRNPQGNESEELRHIEAFICPNCRKLSIDVYANYCYNCGQALDWSGKND